MPWRPPVHKALRPLLSPPGAPQRVARVCVELTRRARPRRSAQFRQWAIADDRGEPALFQLRASQVKEWATRQPLPDSADVGDESFERLKGDLKAGNWTPGQAVVWMPLQHTTDYQNCDMRAVDGGTRTYLWGTYHGDPKLVPAVYLLKLDTPQEVWVRFSGACGLSLPAQRLLRFSACPRGAFPRSRVHARSGHCRTSLTSSVTTAGLSA